MRASVRLSPEERRATLRALLSPRAAALEVRAALRAPPASAVRDEADLWLAPEALEAGLRERLTALGRWRPGRPGLLERLWIPLAALLDLEPDYPDAGLLARTWQNAVRPLAPVRIMGIVNVTPDSFSDGALLGSPEAAVAHGLKLMEEGADILDVGGESTRPGATPVRTEAEMERVLPVIQELVRSRSAPVSVDTSKAPVAQAALEAGAELVNDIRAGRADPRLLPTVAAHGAGLVLMHMQGSPADMQAAPHYADVVRTVTATLRASAARAVAAGVDATDLALDPGFGFGKDLQHNLELMRALPELRSLGFPLAVGLSRKSFLGRLSGQSSPRERRHETSAATALAAHLGAEIHRVHEPAGAKAALAVATELASGTQAGAGR